MRKYSALILAALMVTLSLLLSGCAARLPMPTEKEGRFDFSVTYEANGEERTCTGVYVCRFDGAYTSLIGNGRDWSGYIEGADGHTEIAIQTNEDGVIYLDLGFYPEYFMADPDYADHEAPEPILYILYHTDEPDSFFIGREGIDFLEQYGVRLIDYTYAQPLENSYDNKFTFCRFDFNIN